MVITYYGLEFFKIQLGDLVIATNPISKNSGMKTPRFGADIALVSMNHPNFNGTENLSRGDREPFVASGPGEYEVKNILVKGFLTWVKYGGGEKQINTLYYITLEGINICFLGALDTSTISNETHEGIQSVDILFVPVGGGRVLSPADANKVSLSFEPKIVIPMHYDASALKKFLQEAGAEGTKPVEKLTLKKKDVEGKEGEIIVLKQV